MTLLKNTIIQKFLETLDRGNFLRDDFKIDFPSSGNTLVDVTFIAYPKFTFKIEEKRSNSGSFSLVSLAYENKDYETSFSCTMSPGSYKNVESRAYESINQAMSEVTSWKANIREELMAMKPSTVSASQEDELFKDFQDYLEDPVEEPEKFFTDKEAKDLIDKLERLRKRVDELEAREQITETEKNGLYEVIEHTKSDICDYPKGVWYRTAGNKIIRKFKEIVKSKENRDIFIDVMKKIFLEA